MNKYQRYLLRDCSEKFIFQFCTTLSEGNKRKENYYGKFDWEKDNFSIIQDEDINIVDYALITCDIKRLTRNCAIDGISICINGEWNKIEPTMEKAKSFGTNDFLAYRINVNFNNRVEKIKLSFRNNIADDYIVNLNYVEADKEKYYSKIEQNKKAELLKKAKITHATGSDLVNIYFQPCSDAYERTEIYLYKANQMLAKYKVDDGIFFKSISGLAYGNYEYIVKQYDKNSSLLLETDKTKFTIDEPYHGDPPILIS